ncbi:hypothetical protein O2W15_11730 [Modestobacter sp. VKM Ac-2979]|uniref:hypothetical protein n=1 Tax=unclassified Modestobacter TaxID=2643866 RepID=UPI0022AB8690|nr:MULTISPECIES: hypothetical protein [unclassified Modestobacter]MCZ2812105.1 hypothetical protein [Modestobacter sp. VKM Ac-2979]MCZ2843829.1 hypothetical protein [Modestobacter sp. VKM Ac-2980]
MSQTTIGDRRSQIVGALHAAAALLLGWLRADHVADDRGSDSSEKAFMVILAIALGGAVTAAAVAFVASKTALFQ